MQARADGEFPQWPAVHVVGAHLARPDGDDFGTEIVLPHVGLIVNGHSLSLPQTCGRRVA